MGRAANQLLLGVGGANAAVGANWFEDDFYRSDQTGSGVLPVAIADFRNDRYAFDSGSGLAAATLGDIMQIRDGPSAGRIGYWDSNGDPQVHTDGLDLTYYNIEGQDHHGAPGTESRLAFLRDQTSSTERLGYNHLVQSQWTLGGSATRGTQPASWGGVFTDPSLIESGGSATADFVARLMTSTIADGANGFVDVYYEAGASGGSAMIELREDASNYARWTGTIGSMTLATTGSPFGLLTTYTTPGWKETALGGGKYRLRIYLTNNTGAAVSYELRIGPNSATIGDDIIVYGAYYIDDQSSSAIDHSVDFPMLLRNETAGSGFSFAHFYRMHQTNVAPLFENPFSMSLRQAAPNGAFGSILRGAGTALISFWGNQYTKRLQMNHAINAGDASTPGVMDEIGLCIAVGTNAGAISLGGGTAATSTAATTFPNVTGGDEIMVEQSYIDEIIVWDQDIGSNVALHSDAYVAATGRPA